jgi:hypothetical protein
MTRHRFALTRSALAAWAALAAMAAAGCAGDHGAPGDASMRVDTIDGIIHLRHTGRAPVVRLTPVVAVGDAGGLEEASPTEFGRVRSVMADGDGHLYVADGLALEIRVFDAAGRFVRALGRKGGGPGEMEGLHGTTWLTPDTMVVADFGNARLLLMDREGRHLGHWPWVRITGPARFFFNGGPGEVYGYGFRADRQSGGQGMEAIWVRHGPDGPLDSLTVPQLAGPIPGTGVTCRGDGIGFFANPHGERLLTVPAPGGERLVALSSSYRLAFLGPTGDTLRILTRDAPPVPLPDDEWREAADSFAEFQRRWRGASCEGDVRRPRNRPILRQLSFDHHGRLLVELNTADGTALDLYDTDGRWLATIPLPERDPGVPVYLRDDRLFLVTRDSLGVQRVLGYRF